MQDKTERLKLILELVENNLIKTQSNLSECLSKKGVQVNQATLSRDIKELGLAKTTIDGIQRYVSEKSITTTTTTKPITRLARFVKSIDFSRNIIVVKTDIGAASHVAESLDNMGLPEIIGTVAGDNTIIIILSESAQAQLSADKLRSRFST